MLLLIEQKENKKVVICEICSSMIIIGFIVNYIRTINNIDWGFNWRYMTPIYYGLFILYNFLIRTELFNKSFTESFFYAFSLAVFSGFLYELPLFYLRNANLLSINQNRFLFVRSQLIIPFMVYYGSRKKNYSLTHIRLTDLTKILLYATLIMMFITYLDTIHFFGKQIFYHYYRIPSLIFLTSLNYDVAKNGG
jgi:hypothetical protein